ncbi:hypothetical protein [Metabacillus litoralis]|uniref:hypothetical protein n=1 Tax=Metabacillus litoralis TaxID=152268 RepID=UPI0020402350|nr:hypothetical protein [Metabacillus litoralis]MCM3653747.1 hypothetical protein [Metabacillus litoralis]
MNKYVKLGLVILLSIGSILFTQEIKLLKNPDSLPVTSMIIIGLLVLWLFSMIGILIADLAKRSGVKVLQDFPVLGWVAITSLVACLISDFFVTAISAVDFLSITTPILTYAGISVADRLVDLRKTSWKVASVAVFVFMGTYVGSALLSQFGLFITGN